MLDVLYFVRNFETLSKQELENFCTLYDKNNAFTTYISKKNLLEGKPKERYLLALDTLNSGNCVNDLKAYLVYDVAFHLVQINEDFETQNSSLVKALSLVNIDEKLKFFLLCRRAKVLTIISKTNEALDILKNLIKEIDNGFLTDEITIIDVYMSFASLLCVDGLKAQALSYIHKAYNIATHPLDKSDVLTELAIFYLFDHNYELSLKYQLEANEIGLTYLNKSDYYNLFRIGRCYFLLENYKESHLWMDKTIEEFKRVRNQDNSSEAYPLVHIAFIQEKLGKSLESEVTLTKVLSIIEKETFSYKDEIIQDVLFQLFLLKKDYLNAVKYQKLYFEFKLKDKDRIINSKSENFEKQYQSKLKQQEIEQLKKLDDIKTNFFSNITHEFRTPLSLIISPLEQVVKNNNIDNQDRFLLKTALNNSNRLLRLVNQLLDITKLENGNMKLKVVRENLSDFVNYICDGYQNLANEKGIHFVFENRLSNDEVFFDAEILENIIQNLISNAFKFTEPKGKINCLFKTDKLNQFHFSITDTGIGIAKEEQYKIFDRFYQVDTTTTRNYQGTGIGLALVKELVTLLKGSITVQSELGKGTSFSVCIPPIDLTNLDLNTTSTWQKEKTDPMFLLPMKTVDQENETSNKQSILLVEDNEELLDFLSNQFKDTYEIYKASNGEEGYQQSLKHIPSLIITDVSMPKKDGISLVKDLQMNLNTNHIPIIVLTAKTSEKTVISSIIEGADDYMTKPFSLEVLKTKIKAILSKRQKLQEYYSNAIKMGVAIEPNKTNRTDEFVQALIAYIHLNIQEDISINKVAKHFALSPSTLYRKLQFVLNKSLQDIITEIRLSKAREILQSNPNLSIKEIAYQVGYTNPNYFSTAFKKQYQVSPKKIQPRMITSVF